MDSVFISDFPICRDKEDFDWKGVVWNVVIALLAVSSPS